MSVRPIDLSRLNPRQREAVLQTEGPVLVLAGAGSGKTRVIANRVVHLLDKGVPARSILAVTFTNKAAAEMKERIIALAGGDERDPRSKVGAQRCRGLTVSTFHAFGVRLLRQHAERAGIPSKFAIFDSGDQASLVKRLLRDLKVDDKRFDLSRVVSMLSRRRTEGRAARAVAPTAASDDGTGLARGLDPEYELLADELLPRYELGLRAMGAVDFDDLLLLPLKLLREDAAVLQAVQGRFRYLLVDEYQDTNQAQFELLELIAGLRRNLCVVGDDDQSIYSWRGARVQNILGFDQKFPGTVEVFLEQNYRSTNNILEAANAVIGKNPARKPKRLWTDRGHGGNLRVVTAANDEAEAQWVSDEILRLSFEEKIPLSEMAILYRTNGQAKAFEETLRLAGLKYRVVGGTSLFDRKEVRDLLAYLRCALNPADEVSLLRIINTPARGIGDQTVAKAQEAARTSRRPLFDVLRDAERIPGLELAKERVVAFTRVLDRFRPQLMRQGFALAARQLVEEVGLFEEARKGAQSLPAQARRVEAIEGLLKQLLEFEKRAETLSAERALERAAELATLAPSPSPSLSPPDPLAPLDEHDADFAAGLPGYLHRLTLESAEPSDDTGESVTLMTLHGAKGLEWRAVFLCGLEEGLLPHSGKGFDDGGEAQADGALNLEEERRLAYVGITRARERLALTLCRERIRRGKPQPRTPSRFLEDLPEALVDKLDLAGPRTESSQEVQKVKAVSFFAAMDALLKGPEKP